MRRVVIKGYYGFGNLGDDILMISVFRWARSIFANHEIIICSNSKNNSYISDLLGEPVEVIPDNTNLACEWLIWGGGGVFFDFRKGNAMNLVINKLIRFIGYRFFARLYTIYRTVKGNRGIQSRFTAGIGIGLGTYTASSNRFFSDIVNLQRFDYLSVRDPLSFKNLLKYNLRGKINESTDLAFNSELWKPTFSASVKNSLPKIGVILRDWPYDNHAHVDIVLESLNMLIDKYQVEFFAFDKSADSYFIRQTRNQKMTIWVPGKSSLKDYLYQLSSCDLVITSRAHGAIVSACLGIPSICIAIEPKLEQISEMLYRSSQLVRYPLSIVQIKNTIDASLKRLDMLTQAVQADVNHNQHKIKNALSIFEEFIKTKTNP